MGKCTKKEKGGVSFLHFSVLLLQIAEKSDIINLIFTIKEL